MTAPATDVQSAQTPPGAVQCLRIACYNARNGRECWMAEHPDGRFTFEYPDAQAASDAAQRPYDRAEPRHTISTC